MLILTLLLGLSEPASASPAEVTRQQSELHNLARRGVWSGVDRVYRSLVAIEAPLANGDHMVGYEAARSQGQALVALQRIRRITQNDRDDSAWTSARSIIENLELNYGLVSLTVAEHRLPVLIRGDMPFAPDQRAAVERLAEVLRDSREVRGLLPIGTYTVDGTVFTVVPGDQWQAIHVE